MKVLQVITSLRRDCGGPVRSVQGLVSALEVCGVETWLLAMKSDAEPWMAGIRHFRLARASGYWGYRRAMEDAVGEIRPDLVHLNNLWSPDIHAAAAVCRERGIPYVLAPRGTLEPWALNHKRLKKRIAMALYQRRDLNGAAALHATVPKEKESFARLGLTPPAFISPNAVNVPATLPPRAPRPDGFRRALFLSRIHRQKGILEFAEAWGRVRPRGWKFEIAGFDQDGSLAEAQAIARRGGFAEDFISTGPLEDDGKWAAFRRADLFVLPTFTENFGIVVAEALHAGVPVLTTKGAPWPELETRGCGWWTDVGVDGLAAALSKAVAASDAEREQMGERGRTLVEEKYTWAAIAAGMKREYEKILADD